ncbi:MAG: hypothetical protein RQ753_07140 [Desulfurivibrionaceae bacterium]|nr:hypothetical protein [Desulfurivibrionaceae bacterium]
MTTAAVLAPLVISCAGVDPRDVDVELEQSAPEVKITSYTEALADLGSMSKVFDTGAVKIQSADIADNTGTAMTTGGEIQRNITEIMKSTLNSIGGNVVFIEYDPGFIQNQMVTGYSNFDGKLIPDVVITGGITEFDRGLETRGDGVDVGAQATVSGLKSWVPSNEIGVNYGSAGKAGKARITLDFNMKDFTTLAGIAKMTTTNSMEVHKATSQKELGVTIFGPTFGLKGSIKKVQGRHEAVRLLVQASMIQMVGKYLNIPYWRLLGDDTMPDPVVMDSIATIYYSMGPGERVAAIQQWLFVHGYDVRVTGVLDPQTEAALVKFAPDYQVGSGEIGEGLFTDIYINMPYDAAAAGRRAALNNILYQQAVAQAEPAAAPQAAPESTAVSYEEPAVVEQVAATARVETAPQEATSSTVKPAGKGNTLKSTGFGRMLDDSEW